MEMKVGILNGSHTALVAGALLSGIETVGEAMADGTASAFLNACLFGEILPTLGDTRQNRDFANDVLDRFRNPFIRHVWRSIALNSVSKFSVRVLPTLLRYHELNGNFPKGLSMSLALLIRFYQTDAPDDDPAAVRAVRTGTVPEILKNKALWQADLSALTDIITEDLRIIAERGARGAMQWILSE